MFSPCIYLGKDVAKASSPSDIDDVSVRTCCTILSCVCLIHNNKKHSSVNSLTSQLIRELIMKSDQHIQQWRTEMSVLEVTEKAFCSFLLKMTRDTQCNSATHLNTHYLKKKLPTSLFFPIPNLLSRAWDQPCKPSEPSPKSLTPLPFCHISCILKWQCLLEIQTPLSTPDSSWRSQQCKGTVIQSTAAITLLSSVKFAFLHWASHCQTPYRPQHAFFQSSRYSMRWITAGVTFHLLELWRPVLLFSSSSSAFVWV